jgi:hypothetical protein
MRGCLAVPRSVLQRLGLHSCLTGRCEAFARAAPPPTHPHLYDRNTALDAVRLTDRVSTICMRDVIASFGNPAACSLANASSPSGLIAKRHDAHAHTGCFSSDKMHDATVIDGYDVCICSQAAHVTCLSSSSCVQWALSTAAERANTALHMGHSAYLALVTLVERRLCDSRAGMFLHLSG